jgi:4-amino-4-deoxy-L-arabinose transferase-like glycosyltransferase
MKNIIFEKKIFEKIWFQLTLVMAAALIPRLWLAFFLRKSSLTFDEIISFSVAEKPLDQIWSYVKWEMHPPLHYYFLHFWLAAFGTTEFSARSSSIFLSVFTAAALYFLGEEIFKSRLAGFSAAILYSLSPLFCFYGIWARMYTMLFLFASLSFLYFFKYLKISGKKSAIPGALFCLFSLAALFTHLTAGLVIAIEGAYLLYLILTGQAKFAELIKKFSFPALIIVLAYGSWFWNFWRLRLGALQGDAWYFNAQQATSPFFLILYDCLKYLTPFDQYFPTLLAFALLVILGFFSFASLAFDRKKGLHSRTFFSGGFFFSLLVLFLSFIGLFLTRLFVLRYAIMPAIGLFLILGYGFSRAPRLIQAATGIIFLLLSAVSFYGLFSANLYSDDWKGAAAYVSQNEKPGDKIIGSLYSNILSLDFYYRGKLPIAAPLDEKYRGGNLLLTTIKTNIYPTTDRNNVGQLADFISGAPRIFLILADPYGAFLGAPKIVENWLEDRGYVEVSAWPANESSSSGVWLMEKK